jgi:hypothetical protein
MSNKKTKDTDEIRPEYDFNGGERGKYSKRYAEGSNVVVVDPDLADVFPNAESVNRALRALAEIIRAERRAS